MVCRFGIVLVVCAVTSGGCSASGPDCSAENVISAVKRIGRQKIESHPGLIYVFDFDASKYEVNAIRTQNQSSKQCACAAEFRFVPELTKALRDVRVSDPQQFQSLIANNYMQAQTKELKASIEYKAEITDKGDDVYVTVTGL